MKNVFISVKDKLPETYQVEGEDYKRSAVYLCLINGAHHILLELNTGYDEGGYWEVWYSAILEDTVDNVTHWCDCIPELPDLTKGEG